MRYGHAVSLCLLLGACSSQDLLDRDGDGQRSRAAGGTDCDDSDPTIYLGAQELCGNGADDDCDNDVDEDGVGSQPFFLDSDRDGYGARNTQVLRCAIADGFADNDDDCDDEDPEFNPGATDDTCDGKDQDCDQVLDNDAVLVPWYVDADRDGWGTGDVALESCKPSEPGYAKQSGDCEDGDASVHPGAPEVCNGKDDDCDEDIDGPVIGAGPQCVAQDCMEVHTRRASPENADFWIRDQRAGGVPVLAECASVAGAGDGWLHITLPWIREDGAETFAIGGTEGGFASWVERDGQDVPVLDSVWRCQIPMRWARFQVATPTEFTELYGGFSLFADELSRTDRPWGGVDNVQRNWGGERGRNEACNNGAVLFGTPGLMLKSGGTWPGTKDDPRWAQPDSSGCAGAEEDRCRDWQTRGIQELPGAQALRWEIHGTLSDHNPATTIRYIDIYVR